MNVIMEVLITPNKTNLAEEEYDPYDGVALQVGWI